MVNYFEINHGIYIVTCIRHWYLSLTCY